MTQIVGACDVIINVLKSVLLLINIPISLEFINSNDNDKWNRAANVN